jgi:molecular chaperone GrpE
MQGESEREDESGIVDETAIESGETTPGSEPAADPLAQAQAEAARLKDAWMRSAADFDNFRKRTRRELEEARRSGREDLLRVMLPVFDNLGRAIQSAGRSTDTKAMADGLALVERQFVEALGREGITKVPTIGHAFDPGVHEAIQQVETDEHPAGTVIAEVQPGDMQGERLMRAAMVVVARPKPDARATGDASGEAAN